MRAKVALIALLVGATAASVCIADWRDRAHQPEKVMDTLGVVPGMVIGEVGAGRGYFTFWLSRRVGETGKVYANDIVPGVLESVRERCDREGVNNIETILGEVDDPLLPEGELDMVFIVNAFHDFTQPVTLLNNLVPSLKPGASVVIIDRDPEKYRDPSNHFKSREQVLETITQSDFVLDRVETFLSQHNIYVIRPKIARGGRE
jgi:ubiquinone/menaquinone biosynthesis C-methylase UbiE